VVRSPAMAARIESGASAAQEQELEVRSGEVIL